MRVALVRLACWTEPVTSHHHSIVELFPLPVQKSVDSHPRAVPLVGGLGLRDVGVVVVCTAHAGTVDDTEQKARHPDVADVSVNNPGVDAWLEGSGRRDGQAAERAKPVRVSWWMSRCFATTVDEAKPYAVSSAVVVMASVSAE